MPTAPPAGRGGNTDARLQVRTSGRRELWAVAVGGMIGTGLRLGLDTVIPHNPAGFPVSTLIINVAGSFLLGAWMATLWRRPGTPNWLKLGLGTGVIGSFTTFSALIVSLLSEVQHGSWLVAVLYLVISLTLGCGAALLGLSIRKRTGSDTGERAKG